MKPNIISIVKLTNNHFDIFTQTILRKIIPSKEKDYEKQTQELGNVRK
jgi:hypothetical protein